MLRDCNGAIARNACSIERIAMVVNHSPSRQVADCARAKSSLFPIICWREERSAKCLSRPAAHSGTRLTLVRALDPSNDDDPR